MKDKQKALESTLGNRFSKEKMLRKKCGETGGFCSQ
jgi:hypothetical protein